MLNIPTKIVPWIYGDGVVSHNQNELLLYFITRQCLETLFVDTTKFGAHCVFPLYLFLYFSSGCKGLWRTHTHIYMYILSPKLSLVL